VIRKRNADGYDTQEYSLSLGTTIQQQILKLMEDANRLAQMSPKRSELT